MVRCAWMLGLVMSAAAAAQTAAPCPTDGSAKPKGCVAAQDKGAANAFPYPGDTPDKAPDAPAPVAPAPDAPKTVAPDAPAPAGSTADKFPYPGEEKPAAPKSGAGDKFPYPGEAPADSSSSSSSSSALPPDASAPPDDKGPLKDEGTSGSTKTARRRLRPPAQKILSDPEREDEDITVAKFYQSRGNLQGAYLRAKDAVKIQPDDPDGHWLLADVADKMGKKDEAATEYEAYLKLDPAGDHVKAAKTALGKLKN